MVCCIRCAYPVRITRGRVAVAAAAALVLVFALCPYADAGAWESAGLSLPIPAREEPLDLFVREIGGGAPAGASVRILRYGSRGSLEQPGTLQIPRVGRAFSVHAFDLVTPMDRTVEVRRLPGYRGWLELRPGAYAIPLSEERFELIYGSALWDTDAEDTRGLRVTAGPVSVSGRGELVLERRSGEEDLLVLVVRRGRFEIAREDVLEAVIAAGQERRLPLSTGGDVPQRLSEQRRVLGTRLEHAVGELRQGPLTGETLTDLWDTVRRTAPLYAHAEVHALGDVPHPDLIMRALGDSLRLLASFQYAPGESSSF